MNIVDIATEHATKANALVISEIVIEIGELSRVVFDALNFALEMAFKDTILRNSKLSIIRVPGKVRCRGCNHIFFTRNLPVTCSECGQCRISILLGRELRLKSILV